MSKRGLSKLIFNIIGEKNFVKLRYFQRTGRVLNLKSPTRFSEKLQFLKLNDKRPIYKIYADKVRVKDEVGRKVGFRHVIPNKLVIDDINDILAIHGNFENCIFKATHDSGSRFIVKKGQEFNRKVIYDYFRPRMANSFYYGNAEFEYKDIPPRVIVEDIISDGSGNLLLNDFKIHCFNGEPVFIQTINSRVEGVKETWYDCNWNKLDMWYFSPNSDLQERPIGLVGMLEIAKTLANNFPYVRVDLYQVKELILFGECTFRPYGGYMKWNRDMIDFELGELLDISRFESGE